MPPIEYFKHVILELKSEGGSKSATQLSAQSSVQQPPQPPGALSSVAAGASASATRQSVLGLQKRFDEVIYDTMC